MREFFKPTRHAVFLFFILFFFYFNWPLPPRTSETRNDWEVSASVFSEIKRDFTRFWSSHVLKFFQNSKLSSCFVVKIKKKNISRKKKWKSEFCKIKCAQKNKCGRQLWDTDFFFFILLALSYSTLVPFGVPVEYPGGVPWQKPTAQILQIVVLSKFQRLKIQSLWLCTHGRLFWIEKSIFQTEFSILELRGIFQRLKIQSERLTFQFKKVCRECTLKKIEFSIFGI